MAETLIDTQRNCQIDGSSQPPMQQEAEPRIIPRFMRGHLSRPYDDFQVHQQIQIERETMKFLKKCRRFKRPPQSIRVSGANVVTEVDRLRYFSKFETELLEHQITCKNSKIKELVEASKGMEFSKLTAADRKKLHRFSIVVVRPIIDYHTVMVRFEKKDCSNGICESQRGR